MKRPLKHRFRYIILVVALAGLTSISSNTLTVSLAQVCMSPITYINDTREDQPHYIDYTPSEVSLINAALAIGITVMTLPVTVIFDRYGLRWPLFIAGIVSAASTALIPLATFRHLYLVLILRVLQGAAYAVNMPVVGKLCSSWASLKQTGIFISTLTSYLSLSSGLTNSLGGIICERMGWPWVYYMHTAFGFAVYIAWLCVYDNRPADCAKVSPKELGKIQLNKTRAQIDGAGRSTPYKYLATDIVVWVVWISAFGELFVSVFLTLYSPYYIRNALKYSIEKTGHFAGLRALQLPFRLLFGYASDRISAISEDIKLIVFNTIAIGGAGLALCALAFVPEELPWLGVFLLTLVAVVQGAGPVGFIKCAVFYGRQYSQFIISTIQLIKCAALFLAPATVAFFVSDEADLAQWEPIFLAAGIYSLVAALFFCKWSSAEAAVYTDDTYPQKLERRQSDCEDNEKVAPKLEMSDLK